MALSVFILKAIHQNADFKQDGISRFLGNSTTIMMINCEDRALEMSRMKKREEEKLKFAFYQA